MQNSEFSLKHLNRDQLGLRHAISQAVALNAPGGTIVLYVTSIASLVAFTFQSYGTGLFAIPLILLLSLVVYSLMSFSMYEFSKHLSSSGGYYTFVSRGLGKTLGYLTAVLYLSYLVLSFTGFGVLGFIGFLYGLTYSLGISIPFSQYLWIPVVIAFATVVMLLIRSGIKPSLKFVSYTIVVELLFFLVTSIALLIIYRSHFTLTPFTPAPLGNNIEYVATMMIYSIGAFVGIGGALPIAEETRRPKRNVPLAIVSTIVILGVVIIISAFSQLIAWTGLHSIASFANSNLYPYPVVTIYQHSFGILDPIILAIMIILVINSYFTATVSLGTNATRVLFSMSREKIINRRLSETDGKTGSPRNAVMFVYIISMIIVVLTGIGFQILYRGEGTTSALVYASLFLLVLESPMAYLIHIMTNTSLYVYLKKNQQKISLMRHIIVPSISTISLIFAVFVAIYFNLSAPYIYGVYGALVWIVVLFSVTVIMRVRFREKLDLVGDFSL
ncbi:MAG: APC family permease [Candidatus Thermoplasmatota archaeon]|nr:APC family permease [Candidatus Thermoplasmatota archaeon]